MQMPWDDPSDSDETQIERNNLFLWVAVTNQVRDEAFRYVPSLLALALIVTLAIGISIQP